jgi:hypothetical protein
VGGNDVMTLSDGTQITFIGIDHKGSGHRTALDSR